MTSTPDPGPPRARAPRMAPEDRRQAIVEAAAPLFAELGAHVTTKQIAEAAGIAEGTVFRAFPDKDALLRAVMVEAVSPAGAHERLEAALAGAPTLVEKVRLAITRSRENGERAMATVMALRPALAAGHREGAESAGSGPDHCRRPGPPAFMVEAQQRLLDHLTVLVFEPHRDELRVPPHQAALVLRSLMLGTSRWQGAAEALSVDEVADLCLHGIGGGRR